MSGSGKRSVLVSGASIAGPAVAHWLDRYGFDVTVVERAGALRGGGYPIDLRGTAVEVARRMGILPALKEAHISTERMTFLDAAGETITSIRQEVPSTLQELPRHLEIPRGQLADVLYGTIRDDVEFLFGDSIATLDDHDNGVDVRFESGTERTFDIVIAADGLHSNTRRLVLGPEEPFHRYLGHCFAGFTLKNDLGLSREAVAWTVPGRTAAMIAVGESDFLYGFLTFTRDNPPFDEYRDPAAQRELVASAFAEDGWQIPRLVAAMREDGDMFFDIVSQIHLPAWSCGRVAFVGDSAFAPSFMTGQGSSIALVGAYVLAGELATRAGHREAFEAYERTARPYVEANQSLVSAESNLFPKTQEALDRRNEILRQMTDLPTDTPRPEYTALTLPEYGPAS